MATKVAASLRYLFIAGLFALLPGLAHAQVGCEVLREGSTNTYTPAEGGGAHFLWPSLITNNCDWANNGTSQAGWIEIKVPTGAGHCYDAEMSVTIENRSTTKEIAVYAQLLRSTPTWIIEDNALLPLTKRGEPGSIATVLLELPNAFEGIAGEQLAVKGKWVVDYIQNGGYASVRVTATSFRVWEVDCGGA